MSSGNANINSLFQGAQQDGTLTAAGAAVLDIPDLGAQIQQGLGITVDDVDASEVTLVSMLVDDSGSIRFGKNAQTVRDGHNLVLDALHSAKKKDGVLALTRYLNGSLLYAYVALDNAKRMDSSNYDPRGGTPLYDQTVVLLGTVLAKSQEFADNGVPCRGVTLIITDGADEHSLKQTARSCATVIGDMLRTENHIVAAMGIDDGGRTNFRAIFKEMGIPDEWILTPGSDPKEIRKAFALISQTVVRASQGGVGFSQAAMGGFGTP